MASPVLADQIIAVELLVSGLPPERVAAFINMTSSKPFVPAGLVTVSITSHGQGPLVRKLLTTINGASSRCIAKAVVTINIPEPDFLSNLRLDFPLTVIANNEPRGFGANHNAAFCQCETDWFLVLNPDIAFCHDAISALVSRARPSTGLLAPRIVEPGKAEPERHRGLLTPAELLRRRLPSSRLLQSPTWVAGMFMLFRTSAFSQVGGFDPKYFMYVEDADICARLSIAGWDIDVDDSVLVLHDARRESWRRWRALSWHMKSLLKWWSSPVFWSLLRNSRARSR